MRTSAYLLMLLTGACTTSLEVQRVDALSDKTRVGLPYSLPFTQYEIEFVRQVVKCDTKIDVKMTAEVKSANARRDPKMRFVIDPDSLASPLKTTDVKLEYDTNGVATSLNATAEDRTAQVVANVVGSVAKIASMAAMAGAPLVGGTPCTKTTFDALTEIEKMQPALKAAKVLAESRTEALTTLQAKAAALGGNVDERTKTQLSEAFSALSAATEDVAEKTKAFEKQLKLVTFRETVFWPPDGDTFSGSFALHESVINRWATNLDDNPSTINQFTFFATLLPMNLGARDVSRPASANAALGVPFRSPELGHLSICGASACVPHGDVLVSKVSEVPQLGSIYYMPCKSKPFSSIACSFVMLPDGTLKSMGSAQKTATAEGASGTVLSSLDTLSTLQATLSTAKQKQVEAATAALKAEAEYQAAVAALEGNPNAAILAETAALKANVELLQARKAEMDARAALAGAAAVISSE